MIKNMKKNLVIAAVGDESLHKEWIPCKHNEYDLSLIHYGDQKDYSNDCKFLFKEKGPKFHLLSKIIKKNPILLNYKNIWMPDDDLFISPSEIDKIFEIHDQYNLWISQPSIMGWYGLDTTLHHKNCILRYTNYVEIMCPCFEIEALKKCIHTFEENKTGWGIDHIWNQLLNHPTDRLAIIDESIAIHTRPVGSGDTYKNQTNGELSGARKENYEIYKKYDMKNSSYEDLKKGRITSTESFGLSYHNTVEYGRVYKQLEAGIDVSKRFWPPSEIVKNSCDKIREKRTSPSP